MLYNTKFVPEVLKGVKIIWEIVVQYHMCKLHKKTISLYSDKFI